MNKLLHPKYRADIDGLRAIAVLFVVIFHAFPQFLRGGFIGVDIFFVISGFLISSILFQSINNNSLSLSEFYIRRIKRIFPSTAIVLITCIGLGWLILLPEEYAQFGKHIAGGAGFVSNFLLWGESGYFDNSTVTKPLLHLWSLGIEEQFYIFWPFILYAASIKKINLFRITLFLALISFSLNVFLTHKASSAAFYLPLTRFWELLIGSLLAWISLHKTKIFTTAFNTPFPNSLNWLISPNLRSILGAVIIISSAFMITKNLHFPGFWALAPTIGTALIISAGSEVFFNRKILSNKIIVWLGLISFPLYLWHWPLLSFARIIAGTEPHLYLSLVIIGISISLSWLTYSYIEKPIRFGYYKHRIFPPIILVMTLTLIGILGIAIVHNNGFTSRSAANPEIKFSGDIGHEEFYQYLKHNFYKCDPIDLRTQSLLYNDIVRCFQSKDGGKQDIAIIGDSHAEHMFIGLAENMKSNIVFYIKNSNPFYGNKDFTAIFDYIKKSESIKTVIISASWHGRLSEISSDMNLENLLFETAHQLEMANKRVYIADDIPTFSFDPKWCKFSRKLSHATNCSNERKYNDSEYEKYNPSIIGAITNLNNTKIMETYSYFCNDVECSMTTDHSLLYRDGGHLNISGSKFLGKKIISSYPELDKK